jgi:plastocyanin
MRYPLRSAAFARMLAVVLLALALAACGGSLPNERLIELTVTAAGYEPERIEARVGEMVVIRFRNRDSIAHNLNLELPSGTRTIAAEDGVDAVLSFPARTAGSFRFFCSVPGHTEEGVLVISDE